MNRLLAWLAALAAIGVIGTVRAAPPLSAYGHLPALERVTISPQGDKIAFIAVEGEKRRLFVRNVGGDAIIADEVGDTKIRGLAFAGDDYVLVFATHTMKFGNGEVDKWSYRTRAEIGLMLIVNLKTHAIKKMFDHAELAVLYGLVDDFYGAKEVDGRWYAFVHAYGVHAQGNIYRVDLATGAYSIINPLTGDSYGYVLGDAGQVVARARYDYASQSWALYAGAQGDRTVAKRNSPFGDASMAGLGRTPGSVLVTDTRDHADTFDEFSLSTGGDPSPLFSGLLVDEPLRDPTTGLLLGATIDDGQRAVLFDPQLQHRFDAAAKAFPGYRFHLTSYATDLRRMVVRTDGGDDSGTYWLVDMSTGKADELTGLYPEIGPKDVGPTQIFNYTASDGLALDGVLTLPPGTTGKALPLVVMPHGGPIGIHDSIGFDWWPQAFASRGYAVFQPNYRGSSGHGVKFRERGLGEWGGRILTDISDGVAALAAKGMIDPKRVCVVGASYGGYAALAGVTLQHGLYRCAVSVSGVSDVGGMMAEDGGGSDTAIGRDAQRLFGAKSPEDESLRRISPVRHAASADAPILLIHGKDDTTVPFVHSASMSTALQKAGKPFKIVATEGEDHYLSRAATRTQTLEESVAWVEAYNPAR